MYTSKCREQGTVYTLYKIKLKLKMNSSSKNEVVFLVLNVNTKTSELYSFVRSNCTNGGEYRERSIPKEHRHFDHDHFEYFSCVIFGGLPSLTISVKCFQALQFVLLRTVFFLMGLQSSEIQAQCTLGFGT